MNNIFSFILIISLLLLAIKYFNDLKNHQHLKVVVLVFALSCSIFLLNLIFQQIYLASIGLATGYILAPLLFIVHLLKKNGNKRVKQLYNLMTIALVIMIIQYLSQIFHLQVTSLTYVLKTIPIVIGLYVIFNQIQLDETKPFQLIIALYLIDFISFLM